MTIRSLFSIFVYASLAMASRFVPHWPNFTAMNAMALMGGRSLNSPWLGFFSVSIISLATDFVLGFYQGMPFVYLSYGLIALLGTRLQRKNRKRDLFLSFFAASLLFFLLSNFGAWLHNGLYPLSWEGLTYCYTAALPFFVNQLCGDLFFMTSMHGISLVINGKIRYTRFPLHR